MCDLPFSTGGSSSSSSVTTTATSKKGQAVPMHQLAALRNSSQNYCHYQHQLSACMRYLSSLKCSRCLSCPASSTMLVIDCMCFCLQIRLTIDGIDVGFSKVNIYYCRWPRGTAFLLACLLAGLLAG